jgi:hypothetical protein
MAWYVATLAMISLTTLNEGNIANAEIFMILPTVLGMWLVYINKNLLLAGVSLSLAFLLKAPAGFDWAAAMIWLTIFKHDGFQLVRSLKAGWWKLLGGFVFLIALTIGYYGFVGGLEPYVRSALLQNIGYLTSWQTGSHSASGFASPGGLLWRVIILLSLLCGLFLIGLRYKIVSSFKLIVVWFLMALFGALLSERPYPHYLIQPAVPGSLLLSYFLFSQKKLVKIIIVSLGLVTTIAYRQINFWRYPLISYYKNFLKLVTGQQSQESYRNYFDPRTEQTYQLADYLLKTTMPYERVFIWGDEPTIYALSNRLPIGRYTVAYHVLDFNGYQETISAWDQSPPTVVLVMDYETRPFPEMKTRLAADYVLVTKIGQASIYRSL